MQCNFTWNLDPVPVVRLLSLFRLFDEPFWTNHPNDSIGRGCTGASTLLYYAVPYTVGVCILYSRFSCVCCVLSSKDGNSQVSFASHNLCSLHDLSRCYVRVGGMCSGTDRWRACFAYRSRKRSTSVVKMRFKFERTTDWVLRRESVCQILSTRRPARRKRELCYR